MKEKMVRYFCIQFSKLEFKKRILSDESLENYHQGNENMYFLELVFWNIICVAPVNRRKEK